jgi:CheY-like chemotaxis protein
MKGPKKVLVVDDEQIVRICCERTICSSDYELTTVSTPGEGLKLLQETPYDVVISDFKMPCMDGMEFIRHTRELSPNAKIILVTGFATDEARDQAISMGVLFLAKPFSPKELLGAIKEAEEK